MQQVWEHNIITPQSIAGGASFPRYAFNSTMLFFACCKRRGEAFRRPALVDVYPTCDDDDSLTDGLSSSFDGSEESWLERTCSALRRNCVEELEIDMDEKVVDDDDILLISNAMKDCRGVTRLVLRNIESQLEGSMFDVAPLLVQNAFKTIYLEESGDEAVLSVAEELAHESSRGNNIHALHLKGNVLCPAGARAIGDILRQNSAIKEFSFCHNSVTEEGMSSIAQGLRYNHTLKSLDLLGNSINHVSVSKLCNSMTYNDSIEFLCLDFNNFGCAGVQAIASMLSQNNTLRELHLFGNQIDARGAECMASALYFNKSLQKLVLAFNQIGSEGAISLAKSLTVNTTLTALSIPSNNIDREGLAVWGQLLPTMRGLEQLNVGDVFDTTAAEALLKGLERNTKLTELHMESPAFDEISCVEDKLDYLLRSNKCGRSLMYTQNDVPPRLWAAAFAKAGHHISPVGSPDVLYYFVRERPDLFRSRI